MSDRFDEMRSKGINTNDATATAVDIIQGKTAYVGGHKITGSLVPSGGSADLNVFVQSTEPTKKDGIWIKESGSNSPNVYFSNSIGADGSFIDNDTYPAFTQTDIMCSQVIIGDYLYSFGCRQIPAMYKYNLKTKQYVGELSYPSEFKSTSSDSTDAAFAFEYKGNILVFFRSQYIRYYTYYPSTDTYSSVTTIDGTYWNSTDLYWYYIEKYEDDIYIYFSAYYNTNLARKYNLTDKTLTNIVSPALTSISKYSSRPHWSSSVVGNTMFTLTTWYVTVQGGWETTGISTSELKKITLNGDGTATTIERPFFSGQRIAICAIYAAGNYLYGFIYGSNNTKYYVYDIENNTWEEKTSLIPYSIRFGSQYNLLRTERLCAYDYNRGILYIRTPTYPASVFQLPNSPLRQDLEAGTVVINEDFGGNLAKMQSDSNLYVGISNTGIVKLDNQNEKYIDGNHLAFYGDGFKWQLLKNPAGETCTVTFDSDGGGSIQSQTVVIGQTATEPTAPTKSGYVFDCWLLGNQPFNFDTKLISDITLTAKWLESITVTFNDGNGNITTQEVLEGQTATKPATDPTSSTGIFKYWALNGTEFNFNTPITAPITLMAEYDTFTEIEYIESTGTQYIDTGVKGSKNNRVELDVKYNSTQNAINGLTYGAYMRNDIGIYDGKVMWGVSTNSVMSNTTADTNRHTYFIDCTNGSYGMDGNTIGSVTPATVDDSTFNILLFARKGGSGIELYCSEKLYSAKYYINGTLVRDFQPIQYTNTGECCLLDKVENKIYHNAGTGDFNSPLPSQYTELNYIESDGNQYILLDFNLSTDSVIELDYTQNTLGNVVGTQEDTGGVTMRYDAINNNQPRLIRRVQGNSDGYYLSGSSYTLGVRRNIKIDGKKLYLDGSLLGSSTGSYDSLICQAKCAIFGVLVRGEVSTANCPQMKLYSATIVDSIGTRHVLAPAMRNSDSALGLYDRTDDTFYTNSGTGTFISGGVA